MKNGRKIGNMEILTNQLALAKYLKKDALKRGDIGSVVICDREIEAVEELIKKHELDGKNGKDSI